MRHAKHMETLSRLVIRAHCYNKQSTLAADLEQSRLDVRYVGALNASELADFLGLADTHHVSVRALTVLQVAATLDGKKAVAEWCATSLAVERSRIKQAVSSLGRICDALESRGCKVAVIKSLDHWPDLGSDLDLYTTGDAGHVAHVMQEHFGARPMDRSWGDWLANKWNYKVPGLSELVEIHVQYLGQTGEHEKIAQRVIGRRVLKTIGSRDFPVPAPEERVVIATLQRMYRHFYFRLCDMIDIATLLQAKAIDLAELKESASEAGIWHGVVTFLCLVQRYVQSYGGVLLLPNEVVASVHCRQSRLRFKRVLLRVPIATAAGLYASQLLQAGLRRDVRALLRLPLLPPLAVSALVVHGLTGSDKGVW